MSERNVAIVTGGSTGIGAEICRRMIAQGYETISLALRRPDWSDKRLQVVEVDLTDAKATAAVASDIASHFEVSHVVHNAGAIRPALLGDVKAEDLNALTQLHLGAALALVQATLPGMKAKGFGRIILMSSIAANGSSGQAGYCASKAGLLGLSATLSKEYGKKGITSNVISPGFIETEMTKELMSDRNREFWLQHVPLGRLGELPEVSKLVVVLASPGAGYINGMELRVDGGLSWAP